CHEAALLDALGVVVFLVMESDRFQREDRFARLGHRFDCVLETLRGNDRAELTAITNDYSYASGQSDPRNPRDEGSGLCSARADADRVELASNTGVADIDIIAARGEINTG